MIMASVEMKERFEKQCEAIMKYNNVGNNSKHLLKLLFLNSVVQSSMIRETCNNTSARVASVESDVEVLKQRQRVINVDLIEIKFPGVFCSNPSIRWG